MTYANTYNAFQIDNLTLGQKAVLTAIATFERNGKAWPSVATLAKRASMGVRTCQRHLAALINLGYITRTYRAGHAAVTRLFIGQTPAKLAPPPLPNWHPESVIPESVNQIQRVPETAEAAMPPLCLESKIPQTEPPTPAIQEIESLPDYCAQLQVFANSQYAPTEAPKTLLEPFNESDKASAPTDTPTPAVEHQADQATEYQAVSDQTQDQAEAPATEADPLAEWAKIDPEVLLSIMDIRKAKRKKPEPSKIEVKHWYSVAMAAGWSLPQIAYVMVLRNWSRIDDASWLQHVPRPQLQPGTGTPAAPAAPKVWTPDPTHIPASPSTIAKMKERIAAMKQKWASEPLNAPRPIRQ